MTIRLNDYKMLKNSSINCMEEIIHTKNIKEKKIRTKEDFEPIKYSVVYYHCMSMETVPPVFLTDKHESL